MTDAEKNPPIEESTRRLALAWFFFIAILFGQFGVLLSIAHDLWVGVAFCKALLRHIANGNFLTFSTAFLAGSVYFIIREYLLKKNIENPSSKAKLVLYAALCGAISIGYIFLLTLDSASLGFFKLMVHWTIYFASIAIGLQLWKIEHDESALAIAKELKDGAERMTKSSRRQTKTVDGTKL